MFHIEYLYRETPATQKNLGNIFIAFIDYETLWKYNGNNNCKTNTFKELEGQKREVGISSLEG